MDSLKWKPAGSFNLSKEPRDKKHTITIISAVFRLLNADGVDLVNMLFFGSGVLLTKTLVRCVVSKPHRDINSPT